MRRLQILRSADNLDHAFLNETLPEIIVEYAAAANRAGEARTMEAARWWPLSEVIGLLRSFETPGISGNANKREQGKADADSSREDAAWDQSLIAQQNYVLQSTNRLFMLAWRLWPDLRSRIDEASHQYREHLAKRGPKPDFSVIGEIEKRFPEQVGFRAPKRVADWRELWRFLGMGNPPQKWDDGDAVGEIEATIRGLWVRSRSDGIPGERAPKDDKDKAAGGNNTIDTGRPAWSRQTEARNKWLYDQCMIGVAYKEILSKLKRKPKSWQDITGIGGLKKAANAYAKRHDLSHIPLRKRGRPRQR